MAPWNFDVVHNAVEIVDCCSSCLVGKLIARNVFVPRDPIGVNCRIRQGDVTNLGGGSSWHYH